MAFLLSINPEKKTLIGLVSKISCTFASPQNFEDLLLKKDEAK